MVSSIASKYGRALAEVVGTAAQQDEALGQLGEFLELMKSSQQLRETMGNPAIPFESKRGVVEALASRMALSSAVRNFLLVVLRNGRISQLGDFAKAYRQALDTKRGVLRGEAASARALDSETRAKMQKSISKLTGQEVRLDFHEDAALIGGVRLRIGSTIYDSSIRTQLDQIQKQLTNQ